MTGAKCCERKFLNYETLCYVNAVFFYGFVIILLAIQKGICYKGAVERKVFMYERGCESVVRTNVLSALPLQSIDNERKKP